MTAVQSFFVRAKHWQVFIVVFGLFCCAQIVSLQTASSSSGAIAIAVPDLLAILVFYGCFVVWHWSMGSFINGLLKPTLRPNLHFFGFAIVYPLAYLLLFNLLFERLTPLLILTIFPLHLLAMFCLFYTPAFVTKNLLAAETGMVSSFRDYAGALFLLWFFPIGIWSIQPRINRLYAATLNQQTA